MTSYLLPPRPPEAVAEDAFLYCVGGLDSPRGETALAPAKRPECLLLFAGLSGAGEVRTPSGVLPVAEGALLAVAAGQGALSTAWAGGACVWALLGGAVPLRWLAEGETLPALPHSPAEGMLRALWRTAELGGAVDGWWGSAQAYGLVMKLRAQAAQTGRAVPPLVEEAAALIRADFAYLGGVEDLADRLGVSKSHLIRCFTAHLGVTPGKYLTHTRMEYAKQLLQGGHYALETVADLVGVSGANYFCKLFKAHTGVTPAVFAANAPRAAARQGGAPGPDPRFYL